jgi:hypothetical protein
MVGWKKKGKGKWVSEIPSTEREETLWEWEFEREKVPERGKKLFGEKWEKERESMRGARAWENLKNFHSKTFFQDFCRVGLRPTPAYLHHWLKDILRPMTQIISVYELVKCWCSHLDLRPPCVMA